MVAGQFLSWVWVIDLIVRFVRELIERLGHEANGGDAALAQEQIDAVKLAAARVFDPSTPEDRIG